ncbi:MAG TPA: ABC transporter substrate-binding protein [Candidatus Intestinimonas merdavium]|uniref:ABC transporter substrate-binding protein n=1 Tax=Candidatus Intestinimonas merdavium TaxID=2838622 RepID=A0A9D1Z481_9FIRM|nr:ABC transporter substrate-binding protein [Candidatus Intestinimonas merdavium]
MKRKLLALTLALLTLTGALAGCGQKTAETSPVPETAAPETSAPVETTAQPTQEAAGTVRFAVLNGPTGVGAAKLMADSEAGATSNTYEVEVFTANDQVAAGLTNGEIDIAAVASNVAANLYNKTDGGIQMLAVSGLGVLYILENGESVHTMADLAGRTLYATGQGANPEYVLNYLLTENGVDPADVDIQWVTADEITTLMVSGEAELCMLPVPAATAVQLKNADVREALDLSAEWDNLQNGSHLTMTTIVARTDFIQENPQAVENFLADYQASVDYVNGDPAAAAELVAGYGITANAQIAEAAIPKCALVFITGPSSMRSAIQGYYEVLYQANPDSIGGGIPDDAFYYQG